MRRFTLVEVDTFSDTFTMIDYTEKALRTAGLEDKIEEMKQKATSSSCYCTIAICDEYIDMANRAMGITEDTYTENDYEEDYI